MFCACMSQSEGEQERSIKSRVRGETRIFPESYVTGNENEEEIKNIFWEDLTGYKVYKVFNTNENRDSQLSTRGGDITMQRMV